MNDLYSCGSNTPMGADSDPNAPWREEPEPTEICSICEGSGYIDPDTHKPSGPYDGIPCPECLGDGRIIIEINDD